MSWAVSPFAWFGGKQRLARRIVELLPAHEIYVEPFGGAAAVLLSKPTARLEVYNDVDHGLVNFFRVLRDRPGELERLLRYTPFSREEYDRCRETWAEQEDELERARRWYVRIEQAYGGSPSTVGWAGETRGRRRKSKAHTSWNRLERLPGIVERLRTVQIEQLDWRAVLDRYDHPGAVFYLDPPYVTATRKRSRQKGGNAYAHELTDADHAELVERIMAMHGTVLLSGYEHELYRPLERGGAERFEFEALAMSTSAVGVAQPRLEILWRLDRSSSSAGTLFDRPAFAPGYGLEVA